MDQFVNIGSNNQLEAELQFTKQMVEALTQNATVAFLVSDLEGCIRYVNQTFTHIFGWTEEEALDQSLTIIPDELRESFEAMLIEHQWEVRNYETYKQRRDGSHFPASESITPIRNLQGEITAYASILRDITDRRLEVRKLKESEQRFRSLFEHNPSAIFCLDMEGRMVTVNAAAVSLFGYEDTELIGKSPDMLVAPEWLEEDRRRLELAKQGQVLHYETAILHRTGRLIELFVTLLPILVDQEKVGVYGIAQDITLQKRNEKLVNFMVFHDPLTDLPNRRMFQERALAAIKETEEGTRLAILMIDLDGFKTINDKLGHEKGDETLQLVGQQLRKCISETDIVARIGGDEFTILLQTLHDAKQASEVAERVIAELGRMSADNGLEYPVSASVGIALYPDDGRTLESLLRKADFAMYSVKENGKNGFSFCS